MANETVRQRLDYETDITYGSADKDVRPIPEEFDRFAELASKLVQVPKEELDEQRKGES
jgi:hypothetical protein